ncbi:MAG: hypothetical protein K0U47_03575 [Epsilonproteobacteria bacterium]|nr:hypothetical protein [Campylobacterota bacterium]
MHIMKIGILGLALLSLTGCDPIVLEDDPVTIDGVVPDILEAIGEDINLSAYLYPAKTLDEGKSISEYIYQYKYSTVTAESIEYQKEIIRDYSGTANSSVNMQEASQQKQLDTVEKGNKITVEFSNDTLNRPILSYSDRRAINEELASYTVNSVLTRCIIKNIIEGTHDLSPLIPEAVRTDFHDHRAREVVALEDRFVYTDTLQVYCGSEDGRMEDRYYAKGIGEVLRITKEWETKEEPILIFLDQNSTQITSL